MKIPAPVILDGFIYGTLALMGYLVSRFGSDDAAKYLAPSTLWWLLTILGGINAVTLALKLFRSVAYAQHLQEKKDTQTWKVEPPKP